MAGLVIKLTQDRLTVKSKFNFIHTGASHRGGRLSGSQAIELLSVLSQGEVDRGLGLQREGRQTIYKKMRRASVGKQVLGAQRQWDTETFGQTSPAELPAAYRT